PFMKRVPTPFSRLGPTPFSPSAETISWGLLRQLESLGVYLRIEPEFMVVLHDAHVIKDIGSLERQQGLGIDPKGHLQAAKTVVEPFGLRRANFFRALQLEI